MPAAGSCSRRAIGFADLDNLVPATGTTVYNIGSVSKAVTAVAVLQLVERGVVGLDDAIQQYFPSFPDKGSRISIRHLLTHTSGIRHYRQSDFPEESDYEIRRSYDSIEEAIGIFKNDPLLFQPGEYYSYTSFGTNLLQGVVESASGLGFEAYLRQHIWGPASMLNSALDVTERIVPHRAKGYLVGDGGVENYPWEDVSYKWAGGGMIGSAEDLVRLGWSLNRGRLLRPETLALMWSPHVDPVLKFNADGPPISENRWKQGLLWRIRDEDSVRRTPESGSGTYVYASGTVRGFNAILLMNYRGEDIVVALLGNGHPVTPALGPTRQFAELFLETDSEGDQE